MENSLLKIQAMEHVRLMEKIFKTFVKRVNKRNYGMIDSTFLKAHRTASRCASKEKERLIGTSKGGKTTNCVFCATKREFPLIF